MHKQSLTHSSQPLAITHLHIKDAIPKCPHHCPVSKMFQELLDLAPEHVQVDTGAITIDVSSVQTLEKIEELLGFEVDLNDLLTLGLLDLYFDKDIKTIIGNYDVDGIMSPFTIQFDWDTERFIFLHHDI